MSKLEELIRLVIRDELRKMLGSDVLYEFEYSYEFDEKLEGLLKEMGEN